MTELLEFNFVKDKETPKVVDNKLFVIGGVDESKNFPANEICDHVNGTFTCYRDKSTLQAPGGFSVTDYHLYLNHVHAYQVEDDHGENCL